MTKKVTFKQGLKMVLRNEGLCMVPMSGASSVELDINMARNVGGRLGYPSLKDPYDTELFAAILAERFSNPEVLVWLVTDEHPTVTHKVRYTGESASVRVIYDDWKRLHRAGVLALGLTPVGQKRNSLEVKENSNIYRQVTNAQQRRYN